MIRGSREFLLQWIMNPFLRKKIKAYKSDDLVCYIKTIGAYKSGEQNRLFHKFLGIFWDSGCSSFNDYDELRDWYKTIAGLKVVDVKKMSVEYPVIVKPFISAIENVLGVKIPDIIVEYNETTYRSWGDVKKSDATRAIKSLMHDMDESGVLGSSKGVDYEKTLRALGEWMDF